MQAQDGDTWFEAEEDFVQDVCGVPEKIDVAKKEGISQNVEVKNDLPMETLSEKIYGRWNTMTPGDEAKAGCPEHQAQDEAKWKSVIKELHLDVPTNRHKEHLDLCCGDGRILTKVILPLNNKFKHHTGVDRSSSLIVEFRDILNGEAYEQYKDVVDVIQQDLQEYDPQEKKFGLVTACWCLGFFTRQEKIKLLEKVKCMLDDGGVFLLKESVKEERNRQRGNDGYTALTIEDLECLF